MILNFTYRQNSVYTETDSQQDEEDDLSRFTAARFSTTPSKEKATAILCNKSQSPAEVTSHTTESQPCESDMETVNCCQQDMLPTFQQCNFSLEFPEILSQNYLYAIKD